MNYITNYYKNLSEQLQQQLNFLEKEYRKLNESQYTDPTRMGDELDTVSGMYGYNMGTANPNYYEGGNVMQTNNMSTSMPGRPARPPQGGFGTSNRPVQPGGGFGTSSGGGQPRPPQGGFGTSNRPVQPGGGFGTSSGGGQPRPPQGGFGTSNRPVQPGAGFGTSSGGGGQPRPPQGGFGTSNRPVQPGGGFGTSSGGGGQPTPPQGGFGTSDRPVQPGAGFGTSSGGGGQPGGPAISVGGDVSQGINQPINTTGGRNNQAGLAMFMSAWGTNNPQFDYNGDGIVDGADLGIFLGRS
jgi:hypothetical protein